MIGAWLWLAGAVIFNVTANILLKRAMAAAEAPLTLASLPAILSVELLLGCLAAALLLGCYLLALRGLPVSVAYCIVTGAAMAGLILVEWTYLRAPIAVGTWVGVGFIIAGIALVSTTRNG